MANMIVNGMDKNWGRLIIIYGLTDEQVKEVETNVTIKDCEVYATDSFTDTIALPQMASIVMWKELSEDDKSFFVEYYSEVVPFAETVIIIGDVDADISHALKKSFSIYSSYDEFASKMKYDILNAYGKFKKNLNYSNTLALSLNILRLIHQKQYITTKELAERLELSERTVQRYIETLRVAGEDIVYDTSKKGWTLQMDGKSILLGDAFCQKN